MDHHFKTLNKKVYKLFDINCANNDQICPADLLLQLFLGHPVLKIKAYCGGREIE
jgi:hypothetical protein